MENKDFVKLIEATGFGNVARELGLVDANDLLPAAYVQPPTPKAPKAKAPYRRRRPRCRRRRSRRLLQLILLLEGHLREARVSPQNPPQLKGQAPP